MPDDYLTPAARAKVDRIEAALGDVHDQPPADTAAADDRAALLEGARLDLERDIIAIAGVRRRRGRGGVTLGTNAATLRDLAFTLEILDRRTGERDAILAAHAAEVADLEAQVETLDARLARLAGIADSACVAAQTVNASYLEPAALAPLRAALEDLAAELGELEETSRP